MVVRFTRDDSVLQCCARLLTALEIVRRKTLLDRNIAAKKGQHW